MSQRRSYSSSNDFNLDDLFRPEPGQQPQGQQPAQQPSAPQQPPVPGQGGPEFWGAPQAPAQPPAQPPVQAGAASETQYLPPYPTSDPAAAQPAQPGVPPQPAYGAPQQPPYGTQPAFGGQQQTFGGQQSFQPAGPGYAPTQSGYGAGPDGGGRPNQKLIIGGVVAGLAAAGILVAVLVSSGGDKGSKVSVAKSVGSSSAAAGGSLQAEAKSMSDLLGRASSSRQSVISAVGSVKSCSNLPDAQTALTQAAGQRDQLVTDLAALKVDKLPNGPQLADALKTAWQASSTADKEYAAWAADSVAACDPAKQGENQHAKNGDAASGQATTAKTQASDLWNAVAAQTSLPTKGKTEL